MTTREQNLETIRKACIAANPEIGELKAFVCGSCGAEDELHYRPIRLADVLNVILEESRYKLPHELDGLTRHQWRNERWIEVLYEWNFLKDDLTDQSDGCLALLASLIQ